METTIQTPPQNKIKKFFKPRNIIIFAIIIGIIILGFYLWQRYGRPTRPPYIYGYRLVNEKISQSAPIVIHLPYETDVSEAQANIQFYPEIEGHWIESDNEKEIIFKPNEKLKLNRYYSVKLTMYHSEASTIAADFLAVEDPQIIAIFPKENSESSELSEITIVFNRPMVPLTTLGYLEKKDVPVEITPETEGRFKWVTTHNLQFIPEERLTRSSNYTVKINPGLVSIDGLKVEGKELNFVTRKLRYLDLTRDKIIYNQPISLYFNQPVDLEKTKKEIILFDNTAGKEIPFIAEYASKKDSSATKDQTTATNPWAKLFTGIVSNLTFDLNPFKKDENANRSIIRVYNQKDRFGREKLWDFDKTYSLHINKAYPEEGDIISDEKRDTTVNTAGPIKEMTAESDKTQYASPDFFDPDGKLWVEFYEEINLSQSSITSEKLKETGYGQKCKDEEEQTASGIECEKVEDKTKIYLIFKSEDIGLGEKLSLNFEKIVNIEGLTINKETITRHITSYPKFEILHSKPAGNSTNASLTEFIFCSNSPIMAPAKEDFDDHFSANLDYELNSWSRAWKVDYTHPEMVCNEGEFRTIINYGLMPESDYVLEFKLEDVFSQKIDYSSEFRTGPMPSEYLSFYHFQAHYNVTNPETTRLTYATKNMEYVNLQICKLSALDFLYFVENKPSYYEPLSTGRCQQVKNESLDLPKRFWIKNYFKIDIKDYFEDPLGHYILTFSHPNYVARHWDTPRPVYERTYATITNLAVAEKRILPQYATYGSQEPLSEEQLANLSNLYLVTDISSLESVSQAQLKLYRGVKTGGGHYDLISAGTYTTTNEGLAFTDVIYDLKGVVISKGGDSTIIPSYESKLNWASMAASAKKIYLYTDKPIYQPTQEVYIKGLYRIGYDGSYEIYQEKNVNLEIFNSKNDEIFNQDLEVSDFGTFHTEFLLPQDSPLGTYRICAQEYQCSYIDVQEYVPAPFEVNLSTDKEEYVSKDIVTLNVEANYYFGVPLEAGEVTYSLSSQNYYFDRYSDGYFNFGGGWYFWPSYDYGEKFLLRGKTSLNDQGQTQISQTLNLEQLFKDESDRKSKIIVCDVTIKNPQGQTVSSQKSFILHAGEFYLGIKPDKTFLRKNEAFHIKVKSVNSQGEARNVQNITLGIYKVEWIYSKRLEATGGYAYKWEKKRDLIKEYEFSTNSSGDYEQSLKIAEEGQYELEVSSYDSRQNRVFSTQSIYVWGEKQVSIRPTTDTTLDLEAEKSDLNVGEEGEIIIKSPYERAKALITIERGKIFDYEVRDIQGNLSAFTFSIKEEYMPNIYVSVLLMAGEPEIKFGSLEFSVNTREKELDIEVTSNKKFYLPGEQVTLDINSSDWQGNPVPTELSVAVVDLSVLALKGNPKKDPLVFFYGGFPLTVSTASNIKNILIEAEIPETKGGGGMAAEELATKKRGVFRETAFWQALVRTDESGHAQIQFILPDNLTTWQIEALGLTKDTRLGTDYQEFTTRKELMVVPLKPRFIVPGDVFFVGAKIFNQSNERQRITVSFESQTLTIKESEVQKRIDINPDKTSTVYFEVEAPPSLEHGKHYFVLSARSESLEDTIEQTIDITPNQTYETTATANYSNQDIVKEYVFLPDNVIRNKGDLSVKSSATLAVFLSDALNFLMQFPYGCTEQIASRLDAIAIVKRGLNLPNLSEKFNLEKIEYEGKEYTIEEAVEVGLAEIYNHQNYDGGFAFWRRGKSYFYLTLHVVEALHNLSLAGFEINQNALNRAADYLYHEITTDPDLYDSKDTVILTAYILFKLPDFTEKEALKQKIIAVATDDLFINDQINNGSLSYLAIVLTNEGFSPDLKNKIFDTLDNRIDIDSRGAFLEASQKRFWRYWETPIKNTALYLKAQVADRRQNPITDKVIRWLLNSRKKDGAWGSTQNTITVIDGFTDFLQWKKETQSHFSLELLINEDSQGSFEFNPDTILDQFKKTVALQNLKFNEINMATFIKENLNQLENNFYYDMALKYYLPINQLPPRDEGFSITREVYSQDDIENKKPLTQAEVGDVLRVHLQITVPATRHYVMVEDFIPAGAEIVNLDLATEQKSLLLQEKEVQDRELYPDFEELHNDRAFLSKEVLSSGVYEFDYWIRALVKGKFNHLPAQVSEMYFPENFGRTAGSFFEIK